MASKEYKKTYKIAGLCPYCGEALYEDEMCRCQFEDEIEIRTEVAIRTEVTIKSKPESTIAIGSAAVAGHYCENCGSFLKPGQVCGCRPDVRIAGESPEKPAVVKPMVKSGIKPMIRSTAETVAAERTSGVLSDSDYAEPAEGSSGLKSTMRRETGVKSETGFSRANGFLNKANDLD